MSLTKVRPIVVGIGELLWDVFPGGKTLGGAPVNFARHCNQLGASGYPVSCVGADENGAELIEGLASLQMDSAYVSKDYHHDTGSVQVTLDENGTPSYDIREGVAWDVLGISEKLEALAPLWMRFTLVVSLNGIRSRGPQYWPFSGKCPRKS